MKRNYEEKLEIKHIGALDINITQVEIANSTLSGLKE
jgi:hypothetical protein